MLVGLAAVAGVVALLAGGCTAHDTATSAPSTDASELRAPDVRALRPVALPDLSHMTESVRAQIRERHSSLMLKTENPGTPTVELGNAYGAMGTLLMAAEQLDAAESDRKSVV